MAPPKPRLVLRVGVTGHRPNRFDAAAQTIVRQKLASIFSQLQTAAVALHQRESDVFDPAPPEIRIVSALAEGADRVVAQAGLTAGFDLDILLPFPAETYETDFETEASREEFRALLAKARARFILPGHKNASDPGEANRAYEAVGLMTVRQCDILVAVWDGAGSSGRGGTEDIVQHAIANGRPVLRFDEKGSGAFLLHGSSIEPADARDLAARAAHEPAADAAVVRHMVEYLCLPPGPTPLSDEHQRKSAEEARESLCRFLREDEHTRLYTGFSYPLLLSLWSDKKGFWKSFRQAPYKEGTVSEWKDYLAPLEEAGPSVTVPIRDIVMLRFAWADKLANHYGQLHRSGYVSNFMLAALAILFAAVPQARWPAIVELVTIMSIVILTWSGINLHWHQRWVDYRQLSAQLRHLRALVLTGSSSWQSRTPHASDELQPGPQWVSWYYRMTAREIGVLSATVDERYLDMARRAIGHGEIDDQIEYHRKNARRMKKIADQLEWQSVVAFGLTVAICLWEVFGPHRAVDGAQFSWADIPRAASIFLPAFGAALFGIRVHGDFTGSAERSAEMQRRLSTIASQLAGNKPMSFAELSALTEYAAIVMAGELDDWSFVYRGRPLALPT
jgi:hypothetical protein